MNSIFSFTSLKVVSQLTIMSPIIYLYIISNHEQVGQYMAYVPFVTVALELIATEWTKLSILKKTMISSNILIHFLCFLTVTVCVVFALFWFELSSLMIVLLFSSLIFNILGQHLVDVGTLKYRLEDKSNFFKKFLKLKLIIIDVLIPIAILFCIHYLTIALTLYIASFIFLLIFIFTILAYWSNYQYSKKQKLPVEAVYSAWSIYPYLLVKRTDSQALRIAIALTVSPEVLGKLFPFVLFSRGVSVVGTFINYFMIEKNENMFAKINNLHHMFIMICIFPIFVGLLGGGVIDRVGLGPVDFGLSTAIISLAICSIYRLYARGVLLTYKSQIWVARHLLFMVSLKIIIMLIVFKYAPIISYILVLYFFIETIYDHSFARAASLRAYARCTIHR